MVHVAGILFGWDDDRLDAFKVPHDTGGMRSTQARRLRESSAGAPQHRRLQLVEPAVHPEFGVVVAIGLPAVPEAPCLRATAIVVGGQRPAIAERSEILGRIEAVCGRHAEAADRAAAAGGEMGLAAVFDDRQAVARRDRRDAVHVRGLAVEVNRDDCGCPRRDRRGHGRGSIVSLTGSISAKTGRALTIMIARAV